jgi:hypothetical protein
MDDELGQVKADIAALRMEHDLTTTQACNATKEELREEGYKLMDKCPVCLRSHRIHCLIGDHRSSAGKLFCVNYM